MIKANKKLLQRRLQYLQKVKAKIVQNSPAIIDDPLPNELIRLIKQNKISNSCRAIITEQDGLIAFDSAKYTHAQILQVLENDFGFTVPKKLKNEHQLLLVSSALLDYKYIFVFTSNRSTVDPIDELKKYEKNWRLLSEKIKWVYVDFDKYDGARYYLQVLKDKQELLKELRAIKVL